MAKRITAPAPAPAPAPGVRVRIPLAELHAYLAEHGLQIGRRVEEAGGGWYVEMIAARSAVNADGCSVANAG